MNYLRGGLWMNLQKWRDLVHFLVGASTCRLGAQPVMGPEAARNGTPQG